MTITSENILGLLHEVKDPEIPVLDVVEMGIVRDVEYLDGLCTVSITPTYSGCPAMQVIEDEIIDVLKNNGIESAEIKLVYSPPWTTDWMTEDAKRKLKEYGIAPPGKVCGKQHDLMATSGQANSCPFCESDNIEIRAEFGSTACKSLYYCNSCLQPFEYFKCI
ncbi:MAG TPA: 1,2-phenylacetyl-CoA epoxidase subunit PaaD [bacterium]